MTKYIFIINHNITLADCEHYRNYTKIKLWKGQDKGILPQTYWSGGERTGTHTSPQETVPLRNEQVNLPAQTLVDAGR